MGYEPERSRSGELRTEEAEVAQCCLPAADLLGGSREGSGLLTTWTARSPGVRSDCSREEEGVCQGAGEAVGRPEESTCPECGTGKECAEEGED